MHDLENKIIELGAIDAPIEVMQVNEWFQSVIITFAGNNKTSKVQCILEQCYEIALKHDNNYSKNINSDGSKDYEYFMQDIEVIEDRDFYIFNISAWPLDGQIVCKNIMLNIIEQAG